MITMHLHSRETLVSSFLISLVFIMSSVFAAAVEVSLVPLQTLPDKTVEFSLSVKNLGGDNVNRVEMIVPQRDNLPLYSIREIGNPAGWTYEARYAIGASSPFKIVWTSGMSGIGAGDSLNFNFAAASPSVGGNYDFEWKAVDLRGVEDFNKFTVNNFISTLSGLDARAPSSVVAGKDFELTVSARDQNNNVKENYDETVRFSSSDPLAVLPSDYAFKQTDNGVKAFRIRLKTVGEQTLQVTDGSMSKEIKLMVNPSDISRLEVRLSNDTVRPDTAVTLTVMSEDIYGNVKDVTKSSTFEIDREARGKFTSNIYTAEALGKWTVVANYVANARRYSDGALLTVTNELPTPVEVKEPEKAVSMRIVSDDVVQIASNSTKLFFLTVENTGEADVSNVSIYFSGYPDKWMSVSPSVADIGAGKSQKFTVTVSAPDEIEPADIDFVALSKEYSSDELNATKVVKINISEPSQQRESTPASGKVVLSKNLTYLGVAIVVAVVLIVLFWLLFLKEEPKEESKKEESKKDEQKKKKEE